MVDKDVTCMGLAIQRLDAWQHGAEREGDWLRGRKLDPTRVEVPARGACGKRFPFWALCSPRFARGFLPLLYVLPRGLHGAEGLTDFRDGCVCV
jgi:hypothetical protein